MMVTVIRESSLEVKFRGTTGDLGDRLIAALRAGRDAGGEAGPVHSAGLLMVDQDSWPCADLRCDWAPNTCPPDTCPIDAVTHAWQVYAPQVKLEVG